LEDYFRVIEPRVGLAQELTLTAQEPSKLKHQRVSAS